MGTFVDIFFYFNSLALLYNLVYLIAPVVPISGDMLRKGDEIYLLISIDRMS